MAAEPDWKKWDEHTQMFLFDFFEGIGLHLYGWNAVFVSTAILKPDQTAQVIRDLFRSLQEKNGRVRKFEQKLWIFGVGPVIQGRMNIILKHTDRDHSIVCNFTFKVINIRFIYTECEVSLNGRNFFCIRAFYRILCGKWNNRGIFGIFFP